MPHSLSRPALALVPLLAGLALAAAASPAPAAPAGDPLVEVPLYTGYVGVRTASATAPTVRVTAADGTPRAEVTPVTARPADGHWLVELGPPGDLARAVLLQPGDVVRVTAGGQVTTVTVPLMTVDVSADTDTVSGTVPPTPGVYLQLHRDPSWLDGETDPTGKVLAVGAGGRFRAELAGEFDLRPGTWGEVAMLDAAGNVFLVPFAVPAATLHAASYYAVVRAQPTAREVVLSFEDAQGGVRFRSTPALAAGGAVFAPTLFLEGRPEYGAYTPEPGDELVVTVDGREAVREPVPWLTATVDLAAPAVAGLAPTAARVTVSLAASDQPGAPAASGRATADPAGAYRVHLPGLGPVAETAQAQVQGYAGGAAAFTVSGAVPVQALHLYGFRLGGVLAGWGALAAEHRPADGRPVARAAGRAGPGGEFALELFARGEPATFMPGDRVVVTVERGAGLDLLIPAVTADVDGGRRSVSGQAPPGAAVVVRAFAADPDYFGNQQYEQPFTRLAARADDQGRYELRCATADCGTRYGLTAARLGTTDFTLEWLDAPLIGVGVTLATALAKATAGTAVTLTPLDGRGQPGQPRTGLVRPALSGGLPEWSTDLSDLYGAPLAVGDRLRLAVGGQVAEVAVPALSWAASPARDDVRGDGPPLHPFLAAVVARQDNREPAFGVASGATDLTGRFEARFAGFDVQEGDDAELYLLRSGHYLWWTDKGVRDAAPTPVPSPSPTPPPTHVPPSTRLYLPHAESGAPAPWHDTTRHRPARPSPSPKLGMTSD